MHYIFKVSLHTAACGGRKTEYWADTKLRLSSVTCLVKGAKFQPSEIVKTRILLIFRFIVAVRCGVLSRENSTGLDAVGSTAEEFQLG